MQTIQLEAGIWEFNPKERLGASGGFADVFRGKGKDGEVAIKRIKLGEDDSAAREIRIAAELADSASSHLVPALDFGLDPASNQYFIVMPLCDENLDEWLRTHTVTEADTKSIALQILTGLSDAQALVHRDLKPSNILRYEGNWAIADFGIAKFVEESTSLQTLKGALTPAYAAPEQWRLETSSSATDVYALGCIMFRMLSGVVPFPGGEEDARRGHLLKRAPELDLDDRSLESLVMQMLRKSPEARPALNHCRSMLSKQAKGKPSSALSLLKKASLDVERANAEAEEVERLAQTRRDRFSEMATEACDEFVNIRNRLFDLLLEEAPAAERVTDVQISLGPGSLAIQKPKALTVDASKTSDKYGAVSNVDYGKLHVVAHSTLAIRNIVAKIGYNDPSEYIWRATAFCARLEDDGPFRWYEVGFWSFNQDVAPYNLSCESPDFYGAFSNVGTNHNIAYGPLPIDGEDEESFFDRWILLFTIASKGRLLKPNGLPIRENYWAHLEQIASA